MTKSERNDLQAMARIDDYMKTVNSEMCTCSFKATLELEKVLAKELTPDEIKAVIYILFPDLQIKFTHYAIIGDNFEDSFVSFFCDAHGCKKLRDVVATAKAILAIRQHVDGWVWWEGRGYEPKEPKLNGHQSQ